MLPTPAAFPMARKFFAPGGFFPAVAPHAEGMRGRGTETRLLSPDAAPIPGPWARRFPWKSVLSSPRRSPGRRPSRRGRAKGGATGTMRQWADRRRLLLEVSHAQRTALIIFIGGKAVDQPNLQPLRLGKSRLLRGKFQLIAFGRLDRGRGEQRVEPGQVRGRDGGCAGGRKWRGSGGMSEPSCKGRTGLAGKAGGFSGDEGGNTWGFS